MITVATASVQQPITLVGKRITGADKAVTTEPIYRPAPHQHQPDADDRQSGDPTNAEVDTGLAKLDLAGYCPLRLRRADQAGDANCDTSTFS
ncbi:hypothetical protein B1H19_32255 [Streptomyces gilvosporeus]|uniref:Uncharacterized protein n=1 Tax=Streptomyces gilvosporeus TaxID=553510 RepID=A0A1V0TZ32_9ACTN|nr:hypothetical protein B1H19_32255 [Streptomyces gilvosporeus]